MPNFLSCFTTLLHEYAIFFSGIKVLASIFKCNVSGRRLLWFNESAPFSL